MREEDPCIPVTTTEAASKLERSPEAVKKILSELADQGELHFKQSGGSHIWWQSGDRTVEDKNGTQQEFTAFVDAVKNYAIFMLDSDGNVVSWNKGAERIKGYQEDEIVGEHVSRFYTDEDIESGIPEENLELAAANGKVEDEGWRIRQNGNRFWADVTLTAIWDDDGSLQGFTKVTQDRSERREYEQQLQQERDLNKQIIETVPVSIFLTSSPP